MRTIHLDETEYAAFLAFLECALDSERAHEAAANAIAEMSPNPHEEGSDEWEAREQADLAVWDGTIEKLVSACQNEG